MNGCNNMYNQLQLEGHWGENVNSIDESLVKINYVHFIVLPCTVLYCIVLYCNYCVVLKV